MVGANHIPGILSNWGKITEEDINQLLESYNCPDLNFDINEEREVIDDNYYDSDDSDGSDDYYDSDDSDDDNFDINEKGDV